MSGTLMNYRMKKVSGQSGEHRVYYLYDSQSGEWLSTHEETYPFARNNNSVKAEWMRVVNGINCNTTTWPIPAQSEGKLVWVSANAFNTPSDLQIKLYDTTGLLETIPWSGSSEVIKSLDHDLAAGGVRVEIASGPDYIFTGVPAQYPAILIGVRWKY